MRASGPRTLPASASRYHGLRAATVQFGCPVAQGRGAAAKPSDPAVLGLRAAEPPLARIPPATARHLRYLAGGSGPEHGLSRVIPRWVRHATGRALARTNPSVRISDNVTMALEGLSEWLFADPGERRSGHARDGATDT